MVSHFQTSAAGVLALLSEPEPLLRQHALKALNPLVSQFWAEISEQIPLIESLYESKELSKEARDSAALLASKVYYYLGEYDEALSFALGADLAFEAESRTSGSEEFVETIISKAIDRYVQVRLEEEKGAVSSVDPRLRNIIEGIFRRCIEEGEHRQAIGIALESHRLDLISNIYKLENDTSLLSYAMEAVLDTNFSLSFRDEVLRFLYPLFPPLESKCSHVHAITRLMVTLSSVSLALPLFVSLVPGDNLLAFQLAFDLVEGGSQDFLENLRTELPEGEGSTKQFFDKIRQILTGQESVKLYLQFLKRNNKVDMLILKNTKDMFEARSSIYHNALTFQNAFMHCGTTSDVFLRQNLEWLGKASNWSKFTATAALGVIHKGHYEEGMNILEPYLPSDNSNNSVGVPGIHYSEGGSLYALGLINAGCGSGRSVEEYLRDRLRVASNEVVQHGAALGLGVAVMGGRSSEAYEDLKQTLFTDSAVAGEGAGYSMGLVMLGTADNQCADEMLTYARETQHEKIIRGLAVGVAFIFYGRQEEADLKIKLLIAEKDPILRYGGVYALGLAYAGTSNNNAIRQLLHVAVSDTSDDVRRAAVTSLAFLLFKNPSQVPRIVQLLSESYNPHVRCGATLALGIACAGTGLQEAVELLVPMTKDPVDFVRQGALIALGMILVQQSEAASPSLFSIRALYTKVISDKHEDPMARFGAALGQGLIDAGGRNVTISLQSRSGGRNTSAIVGLVLFCQLWYWYPLAHGACLAFAPTAIIGLNSELKVPKFEFQSNAKPSLFAYPSPTKPPTKEFVGKIATAVLSTTAKAKAREKTKEKEKANAESDVMDVDERSEIKKDINDEGQSPVVNDSQTKFEAKNMPDTRKGARRSESSFEMLSNFSRITPTQLPYIVFNVDGRYQPVRSVYPRGNGKGRTSAVKQSAFAVSIDLIPEYDAVGGGILMLIDQHPEQPSDLIDLEPQRALASTNDTQLMTSSSQNLTIMRPHVNLDPEAPEADTPAPFEYPFDDEDQL